MRAVLLIAILLLAGALTLGEASAMVLGGSGLAHRLEGGTFLVEPKGEEIARR